MNKTEIRVERMKAFFERDVNWLRQRTRPTHSLQQIVAFQDVESLLHVLTEKRVLLLRQIKETPSSISSLAKKLNRDRSAVTRDIQLLERFGVIQVSEKTLPGHGRQKWIAPVAAEIRLTAVL